MASFNFLVQKPSIRVYHFQEVRTIFIRTFMRRKWIHRIKFINHHIYIQNKTEFFFHFVNQSWTQANIFHSKFSTRYWLLYIVKKNGHWNCTYVCICQVFHLCVSMNNYINMLIVRDYVWRIFQNIFFDI